MGKSWLKRSGPRKRSSKQRRCTVSGPRYTVQETDADMLLVVRSGSPEREIRPRIIRKREEPVTWPLALRGDPGPWGERLPPELLHRVLRLLAVSEGAVPTLCRVSQVCQMWRVAAAVPALWQDVSLGFCWMEPGRKQLPQMEKKVRSTVQWLVENRFSLLRNFTLQHWKSNVSFVVKVDPSAVGSFLEVAGSRLRHLWLTCSSRMNSILSLVSSGACSMLQLLEVTTEISQDIPSIQLSIEALQAGCPRLQVLRLLNVIWTPKGSAKALQGSTGFLDLLELCLATSSYSFVDDDVCLRILRMSSKLCVLDLRGCYRVTPAGLLRLPCTDLRQLYLGLYCSTQNLTLCKAGSHLLAETWHHSLQELDLTGQCYSEVDLELALQTLVQGGNKLLSSLNLAGTKVTLTSVKDLIENCSTLTYLNLVSCRNLPRGMKRVYRGQNDIQQCLQLLLSNCEDSAGLQEGS